MARKVEADLERREAVADLIAQTILDRPADPKARLWMLLDTWAIMDEAGWSEANVKALYNDILDLFQEYPEADTWFREWREGHPEARLV